MKSTETVFGHRLRLRVCGIWLQEGELLLVHHRLDTHTLWAPPGGGVRYGEDLRQALRREFREETGLEAEVGEFLFYTEFIRPPYHALEMFFRITACRGNLRLGHDPETAGTPLLTGIGYFSAARLRKIPIGERHTILQNCTQPTELLQIKGEFARPHRS